MTVSVNSEGKGFLSIQINGVTSASNGGVGAVANPEGVDVLVLRSVLYIKTASTGAANLGVGVAANATTKGTDIVNDLAMNGAIAGKYYNGNTIQTTAKTEISAPAVWSSSKYLTFTGSADSTGLDATLYVEYLRV
jgi:hypothetical protein